MVMSAIENSINGNRLTVTIDVFGNRLTNYLLFFSPVLFMFTGRKRIVFSLYPRFIRLFSVLY